MIFPILTRKSKQLLAVVCIHNKMRLIPVPILSYVCFACGLISDLDNVCSFTVGGLWQYV